MVGEDLVDPETRESLAAGRRTMGGMLRSAQEHLQKVFIVFAIGLVATIYAMRVWIWPILKRDLLARGADVVVITPFDVILLQAKIGIMVGLLLSLPLLVYFGREPLRRRGLYPDEKIPTWKLAGIGTLSLLLLVGGVVYSYTLFFPIMFDFLAHNAISAGLAPTYSIVDWTEFILVLAFSFALAAQLPLVMTVFSYTGIVPYETFRDKWKYAIVGMFGFGAMFSPPDPFTQMMWAAPLVGLYAFSLYLARIAAAVKRGTAQADMRRSFRENIVVIVGAFFATAGTALWLLGFGGLDLIDRVVRTRVPASLRPSQMTPEAMLPFPGLLGATVVAVAVGLVASLLLTLYFIRPSVEPAAGPAGRMGDPTAIDIDALDASGVHAAPSEVFAAMDEEEALALARTAIDDGDHEKGQAILERYDGADPVREGEMADPETGPDASGTDAASEPDQTDAGGGGIGGATAGLLSAFSEDEVTEEDVGGYYYDIAFILNSLRSAAFRIVAVFILVLVAVFSFLYGGGIGTIKRDFISRLPQAVHPEEVNVITLHPVEALVFEVKIATLLGAVATLPFLLYYIWPSLKERGLASGDRGTFFSWGAAIIAGLLLGSAIGYTYIAPTVVSYLVWDALQANMIIAYRVSNFFWLIFFTTVGIGLLADIPVTMVLFHRGGIVTYPTMVSRWRIVALGTMVGAAVFTPASVLSMVLVTIPVMLAYGLGLSFLWLYTLGGRRAVRPTARSG